MPINCSLLWVRGWSSMGMVVIQPYSSVSKLKKTNTKFLCCTGFLNSIKTVKQDLLLNLALVRQQNFLKLLTSCLTAVKKHVIKVSKGAKIRNRYSQVPHLTQDTNGKVTKSQLDTTNECQEVSPFPAGDHKAHINRRAQRHSKRKTVQKHKRSTKEIPPWNGQ